MKVSPDGSAWNNGIVISTAGACSFPNTVGFTGDSGSGGAVGLVPAPSAGDAAANKFLKASGGWAVPAGGGNIFNSGTPTSGQLAQWTSSTVIQGLSLGTGVPTALGQNTNSTTGLLVNGTTANLGAGYTTTIYDNGTQPTGTLTPAITNSNVQKYTNNGAHTLAPPSITSGQAAHLHLVVTNGASAGAITVSGFTQSDVTAYVTTNAKVFDFYIYAENAFSTLKVVARP